MYLTSYSCLTSDIVLQYHVRVVHVPVLVLQEHVEQVVSEVVGHLGGDTAMGMN